MRRTLGFVVLVAAGCDSGGGSSDGSPGDDCLVIVVNAFPNAGAEDVYYLSDVQFQLSDVDPTATITVADAATQVAVPGVVVLDGPVVTWSGDRALEPQRTYVSTLSYSCGEVTNSWQTSTVGGEITYPGALRGAVYAIDLTEGHWVEPYGIGPLLAPLLAGVEILVSPVSVNETIEMEGALGDGTGNQDLCQPTATFPPASFTNPSFSLDTARFELPLPTGSVVVENLTVSGAFTPPDGQALDGVAVGGSLDTRAFVPLIGGTSDDAFCQLLVAAPATGDCMPCPDGSGPYCTTMLVDDIYAERVGVYAGLVDRTIADVASDPDCTAF